MNRNIKLSPSLIALTWDVIFVWTISTLYFTTVKGITNSQVIALDSIAMLFGCLFCLPVSKLLQNITPIKSVRIGLLGYAGYLLLCIFGTNFATFVVAQPFLAFGYVVLGVKSSSVLSESLTVVKRDKDYSRVYGKGISIFFVLECLGSILITYVYNWKPTMVYWISLGIVCLCMLLTLFYKEPKRFMERNIQLDPKQEKDQTKKKPDSYLKILASSFLIFLLMYAFMIRGLLSISSSSFRIYLNQLIQNGTIPIWLYGYLYAGSRLCSAFSSKYQFKFNLKFGVRSLILFVFFIIIGFVVSGIVYLINPHSIVSIVIIVIMSYLLCSLRMPNQIFLNNYLQVCLPTRNIERAYSFRLMLEYLGYTIISFVYAALLSAFGDNLGLTNLVYIGIFVIPLIVSLVLFIRSLIKKHAQKFTVVKDEYTKD